jgi:DNA helicase IV
LTVLGDLAQATTPGALRSWEDALAHLTLPATTDVELAELTVGYRVPASILDWANGVLAVAAPDVTPARSVRAGGRAPVIAAASTLDEVVALVTAIVAERAGEHATVGVVAPDAVRAPLTGLADGDRVQVVAPAEAKGLEFDAVVVAEPALVVEAAGDDDAGLRLLYVALTRAVQRLDVVHAAPLPAALLRSGG